MGYYIRKLKNKKSKPKWKVQYVSYKKCDQRKTSRAKEPKRTWDISKDRWRYLGFHTYMSIKEAKVRAKQLNAQGQMKRQEERAKKIQEKENHFHLRNLTMLPIEFVEEFEEQFIYRKSHFTEENKKQKSRRRAVTWKAAKRMITTLQIDPSEWFYHDQDFYEYFRQKEYSLGYIYSIITLANLWGHYISRKLVKPFYPIKKPKGHDRARLIDAYYQKKEFHKKPSHPIMLSHLLGIKEAINKPNFNWVYLSVWLGLRPQEIDNLHDESMWKVETLPTKRKVLWVFQTKIIALPPEDRWKPIPLLFDEQLFALKILQDKNFKRPLTKTIQKHLGKEFSLYGGRKGFVDLMLSKGQSIENISIWMGHSTLNRTWRSYKNKKMYHL